MIKFLQAYLDYVSFPLLVAALFWYDADHLKEHALLWCAALCCGLVLWTLAEYAIHRWVLHWWYWHSVHQHHHVNPREHSRFPLWQIPSYFVAAFIVMLPLGWYALPTFVGFTIGYVCFFVVHAAHHHASTWMPRRVMEHGAHHKLNNVNFGVTTHAWDRAFGTYMSRGRT